MSRFCFIILSFLSYTGQGFAQDQDPNVLRDSLKSENIDQRMEASWELFKYYRLTNRDSAFRYANINNQLAASSGDQLSLSKSLNALGFVQRENMEYLKAIDFYNRGLAIAKEHSYKDQIKYLLNNLAIAHTAYGNYDKALDYNLESLKIREKEGNRGDVAIAYTNIGLNYYQIEDYEKALNFYFKALKIKQELVAQPDLASILNNIGLTYVALKKYQEALATFNEVLEICSEECIGNGLLLAGLNSAFTYYTIKDYKKAKEGLLKVKKLAGEQNNKRRLITINYYLAEISFQENEYDKAFALLDETTEILRGTQDKIWQSSIDHLYAQLFKKKGDFDKAYFHLERYSVINDSIYNDESSRKIADLRTQYEVDKKQAEVDLLTAEKRTQQIIIYASIAGGVLSLIVLLLLIKNNREKKEINSILEDQKHKLESLNSTKDKFFSIISHDLRGPVSAFSGVSRLIKHAVQTKNHDELMDVADDIDQSVDHVAGLLDNLLNWAMQQQGHFPNVPEKLNIKLLTEEVQGIFTNMAESKGISLTVDMENDVIVWADQNSTMTILRNLVSNALKFTNKEGKVTIQGQSKGDTAQLTIEDDGLGMSSPEVKNLFDLKGRKSAYGTAGEKGLGLGLQLVYEFVEMNNGTIKIESEGGKGTRFTVQLPLFEPFYIHA